MYEVMTNMCPQKNIINITKGCPIGYPFLLQNNLRGYIALREHAVSKTLPLGRGLYQALRLSTFRPFRPCRGWRGLRVRVP